MIQIQISEITIGPGRRAALPEDVQKMAKSMAEVGLLSPISHRICGKISARNPMVQQSVL